MAVEISTKNLLKTLRKAVPECQLFETEGEPVIGATIPYEELSAFLHGKTQFKRGAAMMKPIIGAEADWTAVLDYWLDQNVGITLYPLQHTTGYELRIYPNRNEKK